MGIQSWFTDLQESIGAQPSRSKRHGDKIRHLRKRQLLVEQLEDRRVFALTTPVFYDVGSNSQETVSADFNNDNIPDIAVANYSSNNVSVLLGNGDGTFLPAINSPTLSSPVSIAVGDLNSDGILDLVTVGGWGYYGEVNVLLGENDGSNQGTGSFLAPTSKSLELFYYESPYSIAVGDFDGDGNQDIAATSSYYYYSSSSSAHVLLGNGLGAMSSPTRSFIDYGNYSTALATNFDGVGADDLVVANSAFYGYYYASQGTVAVMSGSPTGLQAPAFYSTNTDAYDVAVGDVNADGKLDIITADGYYNTVSVFSANGLGGFSTAQSHNVGLYAQSVAIGDFNGDLQVDIAINNSDSLNVIYGKGSGNFSAPVTAAAISGYDLIAGDFDGDGWADAATISFGDVAVLLNDQVWPAAPGLLSINNVTVTEGNTGTTVASFTVTRSDGDPNATVTVNYSTSNDYALAGSDYVAASGVLTFGPNETSKTINIIINGDLLDEFDQGFYVNLWGATNAVIKGGAGFCNILDDDAAPTISITPSFSLKEGSINKTTLFNFVVTLSAPSEKPISVNYATADGNGPSASGNATTANNDYVAKSGTLYFSSGVTSQTISIVVVGDKNKEADEQFFVNLSGASNATLGLAQAIGWILDDDTPPGKKNR